MKRLLVIRFSALGDVAMTLPVMRRVLKESPETEITFVTRSQFAPLFENIERLSVIGVDLNHDYKGISGLYRLASYLKSQCRPDACIDLHRVLRTHLLCFFLRVSGIPCFGIKKERNLKRKMIRTKNLQPLPHTTERYLDVFRKYGLSLPSVPFEFPSVAFSDYDQRVANEFLDNNPLPCIGFAPFAKHETKTLPHHISESIIEKLQDKYRIFLLGGKEDEKKFSLWESKFKNVSGTGSLSLVQQVALISGMKAVISMDSGNMHLAAIQGVPVISIWGATHPGFGFSGIDTKPSTWISAGKDIPCRPCSVFGNKPCSNRQEPLACLNNISADSVINALEKAIK